MSMLRSMCMNRCMNMYKRLSYRHSMRRQMLRLVRRLMNQQDSTFRPGLHRCHLLRSGGHWNSRHRLQSGCSSIPRHKEYFQSRIVLHRPRKTLSHHHHFQNHRNCRKLDRREGSMLCRQHIGHNRPRNSSRMSLLLHSRSRFLWHKHRESKSRWASNSPSRCWMRSWSRRSLILKAKDRSNHRENRPGIRCSRRQSSRHMSLHRSKYLGRAGIFL